MNIEKTWIECQGVRLYGELHIPDNVPATAILICHGMNSQGFHLLRIYSLLAREARKDGFVTFLFDFRGVGKSHGKFDYGLGEQQDVLCALNYLVSRPEVDPTRIFVVGHSLGGAVSLYALRHENRVEGLVLWSVPKNHRYNVRKFIIRTRGKLGLYRFMILSWIDKHLSVSRCFKLEVYGIALRLRDVREKLMKLDECEAVSKLNNVSLLVIIGEADVIVGVDEAQEVFASAHEPKSLLTIRSADHTYAGKEDELVTETIEWIKRHNQIPVKSAPQGSARVNS